MRRTLVVVLALLFLYPQTVCAQEDDDAARLQAAEELVRLIRPAEVNNNILDMMVEARILNPEHWQSLYNKIIVVGFDLGRKEEAKALLARLKTLQPHNPDVEKLGEALAGD